MDFLFDNPLANMDGPSFLVLYSFLIVSTIIGYRVLKKRLDQSAHFAIPPIPHNPDPFEIAYLRGGANEMARAVIFSLAQKKLLKFETDDKTSRIYKTDTPFDRRDGEKSRYECRADRQCRRQMDDDGRRRRSSDFN